MPKRKKNNNFDLWIGLGSLIVGAIGVGIAANEASKPRCPVCNQKLEIVIIHDHGCRQCKMCGRTFDFQ